MSTIILFGATGDLSRRMLLPSLFGLDADSLLPANLAIIGTALHEVEDASFRNMVREAITPLAIERRLEPRVVDQFLGRLSYVAVDASDPSTFSRLGQAATPRSGGGIAIFLSTAPSLFETTIQGLDQAGLAGEHTRLALEKPLGQDLASSRKINDAVALLFPEDRTFRIDHYLGKETVQNLLALRFGNLMFEPLWNAQGVDHVQITVAETVGLEGRTSYFDGMGSLRDMVQNHMLQLLALVAMEPPAHFAADAVRDEKVKVLRSLRAIDVVTESVTGQYGAGAIAGTPVTGYSDELGRASEAETFVALKAHVDNWRWQGVPFYLRTGKRLPARLSEIVIQFRTVPHSIFSGRGAELAANRLIISLQPDENIRLAIMTKQPGLDHEGIRLREIELDVRDTNAFADVRRRIAYERLLSDLIAGESTLFVRRDEVEAQWHWIDAIRRGWREHDVSPKLYAAGTWGPTAAIAMTEREGVSWHD
ncbi:glucose-6-phosphate dehydrogenase [Sphingomonas sp.]|uniref:glucose-6-phosphate dehydrogenase n=1 Tax=Sphingomonas sp. TaxID=28214 RepID=UPI0025DD2743|nr:glucose-6-phosphate dehydrogenase [Sphingomonas sp.]MBV9526762.1 glucose-6-phosphate dehydrogenase [Sphingomonas sp.]